MGCHNSMEPAGTPCSEYSTWAAADPHAKAYGVLFREDAVRMERLYRKLPMTAAAAPHNDELCLKCHAPMGIANRELRHDAVGCESCHGASSQWRTTHYLREWKTRDDNTKAVLGFNGTKDLKHRVEMCAKCHVGAPGAEVDHDLIAAGHPRLFFDYAAYHDLLPRHWKEPDEANFPAKAWAVGRLAAAHASLDLLIHQTKDAKRWPELSHFNCYSCHRRLTDDVNAPVSANRPVGSLGANSWHLAMLDTLGVDASELKKTLNSLNASPTAVATAAEQLKSSIDDKLKALDLASFNPKWAAELERKLATDTTSIRDWDQATQHYLALSALHRALESPAQRRSALTSMRDTLKFEPGRSSPSNFSLEKYLRALAELRAELPRNAEGTRR